MKRNSTRSVRVEAGGNGVVAHVGLHALGSFADRMGLGDGLSAAIAGRSARARHDRGALLVHTALVLAGGGESCADIEHLRLGPELFGPVASNSTLHRVLSGMGAADRRSIADAVAQVRRQVWARSATTTSNGPVYLDIDSSLVEIHSENKEGTGPTYKGGFGFHPMLCFADATGEALSGLLRPGSAGANTVADQVAVLDAAVEQLPAEVQAGHRDGDDSAEVGHRVVVRTDSAGSTAGFMAALSARNMGSFTVARSNDEVQAAIFDAIGIEGIWSPVLARDGSEREDAVVAELTSLVEMPSFPAGTRFIVRREPLHPGAQRSLFPSLEHRYFGFYTSKEGSPAVLDAVMRCERAGQHHAVVAVRPGRRPADRDAETVQILGDGWRRAVDLPTNVGGQGTRSSQRRATPTRPRCRRALNVTTILLVAKHLLSSYSYCRQGGHSAYDL